MEDHSFHQDMLVHMDGALSIHRCIRISRIWALELDASRVGMKVDISILEVESFNAHVICFQMEMVSTVKVCGMSDIRTTLPCCMIL